MITDGLKSKIDSLWEIFWTGSLTNPLDVIEQMTHLMFIHDLDAADTMRVKECAYSKYMGDAIFKNPTPLMLDKIVTAMDGIYEQMHHKAHTVFSPFLRISSNSSALRQPD